MTWKISITVPNGRLASTMNALAALGKIEVERVVEETEEEPIVRVMNKRPTVLSIGQNQPKPGTTNDGIVKILMKLEGKYGAHKVTRAQLNAQIRREGKPESWVSTGVTTAIQQGVLKAAQ